MNHPLRGATAIVGASTAGLGACPGHTEMDIIVSAAHQALADAGLKTTDVDGLFSCSTVYSLATLSIGEYLGIKPKFSDSNQIGGSSFVGHDAHGCDGDSKWSLRNRIDRVRQQSAVSSG
jgi:3-oxoacyl-[acyl-carrier-protein] synthase III